MGNLSAAATAVAGNYRLPPFFHRCVVNTATTTDGVDPPGQIALAIPLVRSGSGKTGTIGWVWWNTIRHGEVGRRGTRADRVTCGGLRLGGWQRSSGRSDGRRSCRGGHSRSSRSYLGRSSRCGCRIFTRRVDLMVALPVGGLAGVLLQESGVLLWGGLAGHPCHIAIPHLLFLMVVVVHKIPADAQRYEYQEPEYFRSHRDPPSNSTLQHGPEIQFRGLLCVVVAPSLVHSLPTIPYRKGSVE